MTTPDLARATAALFADLAKQGWVLGSVRSALPDAATLLHQEAAQYAREAEQARVERDEARRALATAGALLDAGAYEVRLICDALNIPIPETADPIIEAISRLRQASTPTQQVDVDERLSADSGPDPARG